MSVAVKALTMPGEKVLILSPDYNCFFSSIRNNGCEVLETALRRTGDTFEVDWQDFEQKCADEKTTVFLLCNPHNPTGRVWTKAELERMNALCLCHGVKVVSDEIHCELMMPGHRFQPFAAVSEACRQNSVILNSPSKSFNIAGLQTANIICAQPAWRRRIDRAININEVCDLNPFGPVALIAAYNESEDWIDELNEYLWGNYTALCHFVAEHLPMLTVCRLEGTYLPWVDVSALALSSQELAERLLREGRVWVNPGTMYGPVTGEGYIRLNIACPRSLLMEGLRRMAAVING
jgi:cystathionine beta-lyase